MPGPFYFAWAGGQIQERQTIITNGTTHGGIAQQFTIVGDIIDQQIANIASNQGLSNGSLYFIEGPGIPPGAFFIYDGGDRLNLSQSPGHDAQSITLTITKPAVIGDQVVSFSGGNSIAILGNVDLLPGVYGIQGLPIGLAQVPPPTQTGTSTTLSLTGPIPTQVPSAFFVYDGSSGQAVMETLVAVQHTDSGFINPQFGTQTEIITFEVVRLPVSALESGEFPVVITGLPELAPTLITSVPVSAVASLSPGLRYNIVGPGLQVGTTFLAPDHPIDEITIDLPASAAQFAAVLTITGPRTPSEPFDPVKHARFDLDVLSVEISQKEGDFASLTVDVYNPDLGGIGLLAVGNFLWCWLSWDQNWTPDGDNSHPSLVPLFNGKLVGVAKRQANEIVQLEFRARPEDLNAQKEALIQTLQVLPFFDPVWLAENVNPDTVLETYSSLFHIDRTSLKVTTSDILQGEDGIITIQEEDAFYDAFSLEYGQPPLDAVEISGSVSWTQEGDGFVDVTSALVSAFAEAGGIVSGVFGVGTGIPNFGIGGSGRYVVSGGGLISVLLGDGMKNDWPKPGTNIGGGWSLSTLNDGEGVPYCYIVDALQPNGWLQQQFYNVQLAGSGNNPVTAGGGSTDPGSVAVNTVLSSTGMLGYAYPLGVYKIRMILQYKASRTRSETVNAVVTADVQQVLSDPSEADRVKISLNSQFVSVGVDPGGGVPIGNIALPSYFQTDRGAGSFEYLLLLARAKLRFRARAVNVRLAVDWLTALRITLRNSLTYFDRRLPGGVATGKVIELKLVAGEGGMWGEFTIGCAIGHGVAISGAEGEPVYCDDSYVGDDYQVFAGGQDQFITGELAYQTLDQFVVDDDGLDLTQPLSLRNSLLACFVTDGLTAQLKILNQFVNPSVIGQFSSPSPLPGVLFNSDPNQAIRTLTTTANLEMKPVTGSEFHTDFFPAVTQLAMPKTIDLEVA